MDTHEAQVVEGLLEAYREGVFPMADPRTGRMEWYSPDPRAIMPLNQTRDGAADNEPVFHVSRSLESTLRSRRFTITSDAAFEMVVRSCGESWENRAESWIDGRIVWAYSALHRAGHAHSVEAWLPASPRDVQAARDRGPPGEPRVTPVLSADGSRVLVGGVYGVSIGGAFFAESMFCRQECGIARRRDGGLIERPGTDASKVCLVHLVAHLRRCGYVLMDVQMQNSHTTQFGVYEVPRKDYMRRLRAACLLQPVWIPISAEEAG